MVDKEHIFNFLRINGISPSASDGAIERALRIANWHDHDIEVALLKLQGNENPYQKLEHNPHNLFFSDVPIAPETLSSLLGMDVSIPQARQYAEDNRAFNNAQYSTIVVLLTVLTSVVLGVFATLFIMYVYGIGPFYTPVENFVF